ncbi:MAG: hypothetical protein IPG48_15250 [Saprospiraceae bacterium]|jgi:hypothetical protein|nr:hypothetical protein [Saprospiraceae bacterium]MBK6667453.1 hypothetical protein [Saprospiraceae bacterium]MBK7697917.1 hypothetical protein [Saprospiraceae bacterium]MBK8885617.1 hypothetical protein [Saprospiraceae bacterium]MBK9580912.1 hypothetical protein [Saprospiraceae bacterium]
MKNNKSKKTPKGTTGEDSELIKPKKKLPVTDSKINVKSKKFWEEIYDNEGDEIEKFIR